MVTQAPKRSAVFAAVAFALSCIGLMIFVWTQFGGTIPFGAQGYRIHALFKETGLLVPNADVRIAGVDVGKVASVQARGVNSYVTMDLQHQYAPIPVDTRAILRQKTLLGEAYVELSTGNGAGPKFADGDTIPSTHVEDTQQLDQVLGSFDKPTQRNLQALFERHLSLARRTRTGPQRRDRQSRPDVHRARRARRRSQPAKLQRARRDPQLGAPC